MSNLRTPFSLKTPSLSVALKNLLVALYRNWYGLPLLSTRKHLDSNRYFCAAQLQDPSTGKAQLRNDLKAFVADAATLTGVTQYAQKELQDVLNALQSDGELATEERAELAPLFAAPDPFASALAELVYLPTQVNEIFREIYATLNAARSHLSEEEEKSIDSIWADWDRQWQAKRNHEAQIKFSQEALLKLEKLAGARRVAWREFNKGKVTPETLFELSRQSGGRTTRGGETFHMQEKAPRKAEALPEAAAGTASAVDGTDTAVATVNFFSDVRFPGTVKQWEEQLLSVRLTLKQAKESVAAVETAVGFSDVKKPELVDVMISAPGFSEKFNAWHRTIKVYADADSEPALFILKGETRGKTRITVDFRHKERLIGSAIFGCEVSDKTTIGDAKPIGDVPELGGFLDTPPKPADLELRIVLVEKTLHFTLHSANPNIGYHWQKVGETTLRNDDPGKWLSDKITQLNRLARISRDFGRTPTGSTKPAVADPTEIIDGIGTDLWDELIPKELRNEYWNRIKKLRDDGTLKSLLITSDEPWVPWEMLKPYRIDEYTEQSESDGFWAERFELCRWLAGRGPADEVKVSSASIVAPVLDLENVKREVKGISEQFSAHGVQIGEPIKTVAEVQRVIKDASAQLLHFASHGSFEEENVERSKIALQDGVLMPDDLSLSRTANLRQARPLIFLNTCNAGRQSFTPTNLGGWADRLLRNVRAFAVIGAQWEVNDGLAADFAERFYTELLAGKALANAFQEARLAIQKKDPLNPTWLAYTLYGDPNSRVALSKDHL